MLEGNQILKTHAGAQQAFAKNYLYQTDAQIEIHFDEPLHIMAIADIYFGSRYCDMEEFIRHLNIAEVIDGACIVFLGNLVSNPSGSSRKKETDTLTSEQQIAYMSELIRHLDKQGKVLAAVRSQYDGEGRIVSNINISDDKSSKEQRVEVEDVNERLFRETSFPTLINGGVLDLKFRPDRAENDGPNYRIALYSKTGPYKSYVNRSHANKREFELDLAGNVDVVISAYQRTGLVMHEYAGQPPDRGEFISIHAGTYRGNITGKRNHLTDLKMRDQSARDGEPGGEVLTLLPDVKKTTINLTPDHLLRDYIAHKFYKGIEDVAEAGKLSDFLSLLSEKVNFQPQRLRNILNTNQTLIGEIISEQDNIRKLTESRRRG